MYLPTNFNIEELILSIDPEYIFFTISSITFSSVWISSVQVFDKFLARLRRMRFASWRSLSHRNTYKVNKINCKLNIILYRYVKEIAVSLLPIIVSGHFFYVIERQTITRITWLQTIGATHRHPQHQGSYKCVTEILTFWGLEDWE